MIIKPIWCFYTFLTWCNLKVYFYKMEKLERLKMITPDILITQLCKTMFLIVAPVVQLCICGEILCLVVSAALVMCNAQPAVSKKKKIF